MLSKVKNLPVPLLPTMVGSMTLSNVLAGKGFVWMRPFMMILSTIILIAYTIKIIKFPEVVKKEYSQVIPASLYPAFNMMLMLLGSFYVDYSYVLGKTLWSIGVILHAIHIVVFSYRYIIKDRNIDHIFPSWYVTYTGILVAAVVGGAMNAPAFTQALAYFGVFCYLVLLPFQIYKLVKHGLALGSYHTHAILLAPASLSFVALLNSEAPVPTGLLYFLYICIFLTLLYILYRTPYSFAVEWSPGYAGLTFPMAIGTVASGLMSGLLEANGQEQLSFIVGQIQWVQIFFTTVFVGYVLIRLHGMQIRSHERLPEK